MSAPGTIVIDWANGSDTFCLQKVGFLLDLEDKCKAGFPTIMARLEGGGWYVSDVREVIRMGLIGGGMNPKDANTAVRNHIDLNEDGIAPSVLVAYHVMHAAMFGSPKDDPVGKQEPAEATGTGSTTTTAASDDQK
jgi:hypothetical protein